MIQTILEFGLLCFIQLKSALAGEGGVGRLFALELGAPRIQFTAVNSRSSHTLKKETKIFKMKQTVRHHRSRPR